MLLAFGEWGVVLALDGGAVPASREKLMLLLLGFGNWVPYVLASVAAVVATERAADTLLVRWGSRRTRLTIGAVAALLALPYAASLARFAFSGPAARVLPYHDAWVLLATAGVAASFCGAATLVAAGSLARWPQLAAAASAVAAVGCVLISRTTLADEYEPLHLFLGVWSLLFSALFGCSVVKRWRRPGATVAAAVAASLLGCALLAAGLADRWPAISWVLWSRTGASRYVTTRVPIFDTHLESDGSNAELVLKPQLENRLSQAARRARAEAPAPNIVIFSVDGLRPDHLGAYGYKVRSTSPHIDRLAARGVRFVNAFSSYPQTQLFNSSLLFGRYITSMHRTLEVPEDYRQSAITRLLHDKGYHVLVKAWFEHSTTNAFDPKLYGIDTNIPKSTSKQRLEEPLEQRLPLFEKHVSEARALGKPVFMWMHLLGTHPVGSAFVSDRDFPFGGSQVQRYDSAIAGADRWLKHVEGLMKALADPARPTVWFVIADHGVKLDAGGRDLSSSLVRVPLIIAAPTLRPSVRAEAVDTSLDIASTVLDFAGIALPQSYDGISLLPLLDVGDPSGQMKNRLIPLRRQRWEGAIYGDFKLVSYRRSRLFVNMAQDPSEEHNLIADYAGLARLIEARAESEMRRRADALSRGLATEALTRSEAETEAGDNE